MAGIEVLNDGSMDASAKEVRRLDDVERLRAFMIAGRTDVEVCRLTGWSHHRIIRIRMRAEKDGRPVPKASSVRMDVWEGGE